MKIPEHKPGVVRTYTGLMVDIRNLKPEDVCIEDIAHALANQCRFAGHTARYYSVAEHSLRVANLLNTEYGLAALLHDASEAYLVDLPTPVKIMMPEYFSLEYKIMQTIAEKFGFEWPLPAIVDEADHAMLEQEWIELMLANFHETMVPAHACEQFLKKFDELTTCRHNAKNAARLLSYGKIDSIIHSK